MNAQPWLSITALSAVAWSAPDARPCSLEPAPQRTDLHATAGATPTFGAMPVFVGVMGMAPNLIDNATHAEVAVVPVEGFTELFGVSSDLSLWQPAAPLADRHVYTVDGTALLVFAVDASLTALPSATREITVHLHLEDPHDESSCGTIDSCDGIDFTRLDITLGPIDGDVDPPRVYLLELSTPKDGDRMTAIVLASALRSDAHADDRRLEQPAEPRVVQVRALLPRADAGRGPRRPRHARRPRLRVARRRRPARR